VDARVVTAQPLRLAFLHRWQAALARMVLPAAAFALAWSVLQVPLNLSEDTRGWSVVLASTIGPFLVTALAAIFAAIVDAMGWQGHRRTLAMIVAALFASAIGVVLDVFAMVSWVVHTIPRPQSVLTWGNFGWSMMLCTGAVLTYDHYVRARRRAAALLDLHMRAATAGRRAAMVRLQALQARIDPRFLFEALAAVERDYEDDPKLGDRLLDRLIAWLREMLPDLHNASPTLGRELDRAAMWSNLHSAVRRRPLALTVEADGDVRAARFPSMIVVPLAEAILAAVPTVATMTIRAERAGARVALRMRCEGMGDAPALEGLRRRLTELYGGAATLSWTETPEYCEATLEIDDEDPQSDHR
jgi:hypothetical protein